MKRPTPMPEEPDFLVIFHAHILYLYCHLLQFPLYARRFRAQYP